MVKEVRIYDTYISKINASIHPHKELRANVFSRIISPNWQQPKDLATAERMNKMCKFMY